MTLPAEAPVVQVPGESQIRDIPLLFDWFIVLV
jgi:hypothetical protein